MAKCTICGELMQPAEEMFRFHGSLGPCPKPPLPKPEMHVAIYEFAERGDEYWITVSVDGVPYSTIGPFETRAERQRAYADLINTMRQFGAQDASEH